MQTEQAKIFYPQDDPKTQSPFKQTSNEPFGTKLGKKNNKKRDQTENQNMTKSTLLTINVNFY